MRTSAGLRADVEAFARICAKLDGPFADRAMVLSAEGLDERAFARSTQEWIRRFTENGEAASDLCQRFGEAYAGHGPMPTVGIEVAQAPSRQEALEENTPAGYVAQSRDPKSHHALPTFLREPATAGERTATPGERDGFETHVVDVAEIRKKAIPFEPSGSSPHMPTTRPTSPLERRRRTEEHGETVLLFPGELGRWVRFDPQTGAQLAQPYWEQLKPAGKIG